MSTIYFITHSDVFIDANTSITEWSLCERGVKRFQKMLRLDWVKSIAGIYCSTENKAIEGAVILSDFLQLPINTMQELGENDRSSTGYLPALEFEAVANQFFSHPTLSVRGWETAQDAQSRIIAVIHKIVEQNQGNLPLAIVSHGAVGTLLLCHLNGWPIARAHDQPGSGGGNYFSFESDSYKVNHGWCAIDA